MSFRLRGVGQAVVLTCWLEAVRRALVGVGDESRPRGITGRRPPGHHGRFLEGDGRRRFGCLSSRRTTRARGLGLIDMQTMY